MGGWVPFAAEGRRWRWRGGLALNAPLVAVQQEPFLPGCRCRLQNWVEEMSGFLKRERLLLASCTAVQLP